MAVNGRTGIFPHRIDRTTDSNASVDYAHKEVHTGDAFYYTTVVEIDSAGILSVRFDGSASGAKWAHMIWVIESQASITIELREGITNNFETQTAFNHNRNSLNVSMGGFESKDAAATAGTLIYSWQSGGVAATPSRGTAPALARSDEELVLKANTKYEWRITSNVNDNKIAAYFTWYEHINIE